MILQYVAFRNRYHCVSLPLSVSLSHPHTLPIVITLSLSLSLELSPSVSQEQHAHDANAIPVLAAHELFLHPNDHDQSGEGCDSNALACLVDTEHDLP